jgi:hypothetical protein
MERCILDAVPIDLTYIKVLLDLFDFGRYNVISCAPDTVAFMLMLLVLTVR